MNSVEDDTNEYNRTVLYTLEVFYSARDGSNMNSHHPKEEGNITPVGSTNDTICSLQIHYVKCSCKFYEPFFSSTNRKDCTQKLNLNQKSVAFSVIRVL